MTFDIFNEIKELEQAVESGEIVGFTKFSKLIGEADLIKVDLVETSGGRQFFEFTLRSDEGVTTLGVRIPSKSEKQSAIYMAIMNIKNCLNLEGLTENLDIQSAYEKIKSLVDKKPLPVLYKIREYQTISPKDGKEYVNQSLEYIKTNTKKIKSYLKEVEKIEEEYPF